MKNRPDSSNIAVEMETEGAAVEPDGHEGDDERTSGPSGSEMIEKDVEDKIQDQQVDSSCVASLATTEVKPMRIQKKHRRGSRRNRKKYKPYTKMTWDEKRAKLELDAKKANKVREQYTSEKGRPAAPYNTTQFLMDEHDREEPDLGNHLHMQSDSEGEDGDESGDSAGRRMRTDSHSLEDSELEDYNESPEDEIYEQKFFEKDFTEAYEQCHAENLYSMKKDDLVRECITLEERVEALERQLRRIQSVDNGVKDGSFGELPCCTNNITSDRLNNRSSNQELVRALESELNRLKSENAKLKGSSIKSVCIENSA